MYENVIYRFLGNVYSYDKANICKHLCTNIKLSSYIIHAP